jgi:hypothetical protein
MAMAEGVKILDAGAKVLLSGTNAAEVKAVLHDFVRRGAKVVAPPVQLGGEWVTACVFPIQSPPADRTKVEKLGLKRIVTGPTKASVQLRVADMGATLIGDIEDVDGTWTALCDTGGTLSTGFKW